jgi:hypothetical protein
MPDFIVWLNGSNGEWQGGASNKHEAISHYIAMKVDHARDNGLPDPGPYLRSRHFSDFTVMKQARRR